MIVIPMAGLSQRFTRAGYALPKYMLPLKKETVFSNVLRSFERYFTEEQFLFICRDVAGTPKFLEDECKRLGIKNYQVICLEMTTRGQADTVALGLRRSVFDASAPLCIFNIDTLRPGIEFLPPNLLTTIDGYLEVFRGQGDGWSFAQTRSEVDMTVVATTEKRRISDLCSTGLYYFSRASDFLASFDDAASKDSSLWESKELYVAPLYNFLIAQGKKFLAVEIAQDALIPCGIPTEYEALKERFEA